MTSKMAFKTAFFIILALSAYLSLTPVQHPVITTLWDKLNHFLGYFLLYATLDLGFATAEKLAAKVLLVLGYSLLLEIIQHFVPNRDFSLLDMLANGLGILLYLALRPAVAKTGFYLHLKTVPK